MIPQFPQFKNLELSDKEEIETFTSKYPPYSDFNFTSMWSWDIKGEIKISKLNDNLVVKFTNYLTGESFYSYLGHTKVTDTMHRLIELSKKEDLGPTLQLIPEDSIKDLSRSKLTMEEDRNHFDYIYSTEKLAKCSGAEYKTKRNEITKFTTRNPLVETRVINISDTKIKADILRLNYDWLEHKKAKDPYFDIKNELIAIDRFVNANFYDTCAIGIFLDNSLVSYSVNEIISDDYAIGHFYKSNKFGSFDYLMKETSNYLFNTLQVKYINFEQDLGVEGLRKAKLSYRPIEFLKKYIVSETL